jgi:tetratricopeptide (TPR) repeat protein
MNAEEIFHEAIARPPAERPAFLAGACAGDELLKRRVEGLLNAHDNPASFLADRPPGADATIDEPVTERPGTVIGPYKLLEQIGEGGFGVVFMAEQSQPVRRKVALKVLKPGMDTRQVVARFEAERQALAIMDHPNIAKVHDGGATPSGRPYFVMELVKGVPITEFCDQNHLTPRERLELFIPVCLAVQHAHQKGIIHRDLKPSNVLVSRHDTAPVVKVIDFGVAKALGQELTDKTLFTGVAQMIGTPLYMSPEQAGMSDLDIDTRSDVYSLGVLLYELLTGTTPFTKERFKEAAYDEIRRIICEEEPPRPSTRISTLGQEASTVSTHRKSDPKRLSQSFRGELDWIVMKALEKDRNRRYETANGFAMDIQRYLADEPVQACPPSAWYRLRKFARRNKTGLAVAALILFCVVLLGSGIGWFVGEQAARRAETTRQLQDLLTAARSLLANNQVALARQKLAEAKSRMGKDRAVFGSVAEEVEALDAELGKFERFLELVEQAHEAEFPQAPALALRADSPSGMVPLAQRARSERYPGRAVPYLLQALACYRVLEQDDWSARLEGSLLGSDQMAQVRRVSYEQLLWLADDALRRRVDHRFGREPSPSEAAREALVYLGRADTAFSLTSAFYEIRGRCRKALGEEEQARRDEELARQTPGMVALDHYLFAVLAYDARDKAEAVRQCEAALRVERTHYWSLLLLGACLCDLGQQEQDFASAAAVYTGCIMKRPEQVYAYFRRGVAYYKLGRAKDAEAQFREALRLQSDNAGALNGLGVALHEQGKLFEAVAEYQHALRLQADLDEPHVNLGIALREQGELVEAVKEYEEALRMWHNNPEAHLNLGVALAAQDKLAEAVKEYQEALHLRPDFPEAHNNLGNALRGQGRYAEAEVECRKALQLRPDYAEARINLGAVLLAEGKPAEAAAELYKALRLKPDIPEAHTNLAYALNEQGKHAEAEAECREALQRRPDYPEAQCNLGHALRDQGRFAEAVSAFRLGHELGSKRPNWRYRSAEWLRQAEELDALDAKLLKVLHGQAQPADASERVALAWLCQQYKKRYAAAARFYAEAFADQPKLADDLRTSHRYNAACAAALAGCRQGEDAAKLDDAERLRLRRQALDWLRADLAAWGQLLDREPEKTRAAVQKTLRLWQQDADFAGVRGEALAKLHEAERQSWRLLWEDVEQTLKKAGRGDTEENKKEPSK